MDVQSNMKIVWPNATMVAKSSDAERVFFWRRCFLKVSSILILMLSARMRQMILPMVSTVMKKLVMLESGSGKNIAQQDLLNGTPLRVETL